MLFSIKNLSDYKIEATDGNIGHVHSFLFDDRQWVIRYLVVDTGNWLPGRRVLLPPPAMGRPERAIDAFPVRLSREQVKNSPDINTEKPVSRQQEIELYQYYQWEPYWHSAVGPIATPYAPVVPAMSSPAGPDLPAGSDAAEKASEMDADPNLRSTREVRGYKIHAADGTIGHVEDFLVDDDGWVLRYLIVDTRDWLPGKKVLISPGWIQDISWAESRVTVDVSRDKVKDSPAFDSDQPIERAYESNLFAYYGWPEYWV